MKDRKALTIQLSQAEAEALEALAVRKDISKTAVIRQALRLYTLVEHRLVAGGKLFFEDGEKQKSELMVL